jgi:hypothetical protein
VNSSAKTCASGIMVIAQNQSDWPVKWKTLRTTWLGSRSVRMSVQPPEGRGNGHDDHPADHRAVGQDLERVVHALDLPGGDGHRGEGGDGSGHPERGGKRAVRHAPEPCRAGRECPELDFGQGARGGLRVAKGQEGSIWMPTFWRGSCMCWPWSTGSAGWRW